MIAAAVAAAILVVAAPAGAATFSALRPASGAATGSRATRGGSTAPTSIPSPICRSTTSGPGRSRGKYTSAANVGVYLWAIVSAHDLGLIDRVKGRPAGERRRSKKSPTLKRYDGFMYQWYDTNNGNVLLNPGQGDCNETTPMQDNCWFVSAVDNGWYASGLIEVKQALPAVRGLARVAAGADGLLHLLRQPRADRLQRQRVPRRVVSRRARCTAATTSTRARPATTTARCTQTHGSRCTSGWGATRCRATCGGGRGAPPRRSAAPPTRRRRSIPAPATGTPTPIRNRASNSRCGRATTPTRARR